MIRSTCCVNCSFGTLGGIEQHWSVRQSARARRLSVRVFRNGGVEIVVPPRTSPQRVSAFVSEHREWIERQRKRAFAAAAGLATAARGLSLSAIGEEWRCSLAAGSGRRPAVRELRDTKLQLKGAHARGS
jgi:predicted metal-dependent hydrolase